MKNVFFRRKILSAVMSLVLLSLMAFSMSPIASAANSDLEIAIIPDYNNVRPGGTLTYTLVLKNYHKASSDLTGMLFDIKLDPEFFVADKAADIIFSYEGMDYRTVFKDPDGNDVSVVEGIFVGNSTIRVLNLPVFSDGIISIPSSPEDISFLKFTVKLRGSISTDKSVTVTGHDLFLSFGNTNPPTVSSDNKFATQAVEVKTAMSPTGITWKSGKTSYVIGEALDVSDMVITVAYAGAPSRDIAVDASWVTGFSSAAEGTKELTVSYTENSVTKTLTKTITVIEKPSRMLGDVNGDGLIKLADMMAVRGDIVGSKPITDADSFWAADVNGDGMIKLADMMAIRGDIVGSKPIVQPG